MMPVVAGSRALPMGLIASGRQRFFAMLPPIVFPLAAVFVAAIYLLAWKWRTDLLIDTLRKARRLFTVIVATPTELRMEGSGLPGTASLQWPSNQISDIRPAPWTLRLWWRSTPPALRISLHDGDPLDIILGTDDAELAIVAALLRQAVGASQPVVST